MKTLTVTALQPFDYRGRYVRYGETVEVLPTEALALARQRCISLTRTYQTAAFTPEPEPQVVVTRDSVPPKLSRRQRRKYRRRDIVAEP